MTIQDSKHTKTMRQFQAALKRWFASANMSQIEASSMFDISHTLTSRLLKNKGSVSIAVAEKIACEIGKDLPEMLIEGRELLGEKPQFDTYKPKEDHNEAIEAFRLVLLHGGEAAELLAKAAIDLAEKKQAEYEYQHPQFNQTSSKSA